jgi:hypothetical protein
MFIVFVIYILQGAGTELEKIIEGGGNITLDK